MARYLNRPVHGYRHYAVSNKAELDAVLRVGDILLVEGNRRISVAIKYLTQSTWSHSCLYVGDAVDPVNVLIEADVENGVVAVPLANYLKLNLRIYRPIGLTDGDRDRMIQFAVDRLNSAYDLRNVVDLMRYLLPEPPIPLWYRRRLLKLGSGDPTKTVCSTLIAQAFQSVGYPILPRRQLPRTDRRDESLSEGEILTRRHYSFFVPRDFDLSPYFQIVKPTIERHFDYTNFVWQHVVKGNRLNE